MIEQDFGTYTLKYKDSESSMIKSKFKRDANLAEAVENIETFLKACGFGFDRLEIVPEETASPEAL